MSCRAKSSRLTFLNSESLSLRLFDVPSVLQRIVGRHIGYDDKAVFEKEIQSLL